MKEMSRYRDRAEITIRTVGREMKIKDVLNAMIWGKNDLDNKKMLTAVRMKKITDIPYKESILNVLKTHAYIIGTPGLVSKKFSCR